MRSLSCILQEEIWSNHSDTHKNAVWLKSWIKHAQKKYIYDNVENQWQEFDMNQDGLISWDEYRNVTYGTYLDDPDPDDGFNYKQMMVRDERRFKMADKDGDLIATKEEFIGFFE